MSEEVREPFIKRSEVGSSVSEKVVESGQCFYREVPSAIFMHVIP